MSSPLPHPYLPFGEARSTVTVPTDKLFTGQRLDGTGLYYYGARYYDPSIGRFLSPDGIAPDLDNPQSFNKYSYCFNNPLKYIDPIGHWPKWSNIWGGMKNAAQTTVNFVKENIDSIQTGLDVLGMIPVVGEAFDAVNGVIYAARGDAFNAGLSFAACIPVAGAAATGAKLIAKGIDKGRDVVKMAENIKNSGKLGGLEHRGMVNALKENAESLGYKVKTEVKIDTTGGLKPYRYADLGVTDPKTGKEFFYQVGKQTQSGIPVARERAAMSDIALGGKNVIFIPYNCWPW